MPQTISVDPSYYIENHVNTDKSILYTKTLKTFLNFVSELFSNFQILSEGLKFPRIIYLLREPHRQRTMVENGGGYRGRVAIN